MSKLADSNLLLGDQYRNASKLNARVLLHDRFSTNKYGWHRWAFDRMECPAESRILELGCGTGLLWTKNRGRVPPGWDLVLSDFSSGMLRQAAEGISRDRPKARFMRVDAQAIPFGDGRFDAVVANQMLYHVPDLPRALGEIRRVLKEGGTLYAGTGGKPDGPGLGDWAAKAKAGGGGGTRDLRAAQGFTLENGAAALEPFFGRVTRELYEDALEVTEVEPLVDYVQSTISMRLEAGEVPVFRRIVEEEIAARGAVRIAKSGGLFVARKG